MSNTESNLSHLRLELKQVCYSNSNSGFVVLKGRDCDRPDNGSTVTAVGVLPEVAQDPSRAVGEVYKLIGGWKTDPRYGTQYCFDLGYLAPNSELKHFLTKCISGLGESLSDALLNRYSEAELFDILDNTPEKLLDVKGIGPKKLEKIKESWAKKRCLHELSEYLLPVGATPNLVMRVYGHFGTHAVRIVRSNPYSITQVRGIGFKTADALAHKLGTSYNDINRIEAAIEYVLKMAAEEQGHTVLPLEMLLSKLKEILDTESQTVADDLIYEALAQLIQKNCVVVDEHGVSVKAYRQMEEWLHKAIKQRVETALPCAIATPEMVEIFLARMECEMGIVFSKHQKNVVHRLAVGDSMIYALLGYAGTGKTTISKVLLDFLAERFCPRDQIVCCAFTGIAARRVGTLTGYPSYTIHTLLRYRGEDSYVFNENNPLPYSVVLLDEAGMVNLPLFYSLMKALSPHTLFIMVGDPAQLPPIGSGNVFCDVTNWYKFPKTTLTEIHRQREDSILVHLANIVRQGEIPSGYANTYLDYKFIIQDIPNYYSLRKKLSEVEVKELRDRNNAMILQHIRKVVMELANDLENPVWDIQVLSPVRKGILGTEALNPVLQESQSLLKSGHFRVLDDLVQTATVYLRVAIPS